MSQFSYVKEEIVDGVSGLQVSGDPACLVVGACEKGVPNKPYIVGRSSDLAGMLGGGTLPARLKDLFSVASDNTVVVAVPSASDMPGAISSVTMSNQAWPGEVIASGTPTGAYSVVIEIQKTGGLNEAQAKYSLNGGESWSEPFIIPVSGELVIVGVKLSFAITPGATNPFKEGERFSFSTSAPGSSLTAIMAAVQSGLDLYTPEFIYIAQGTDSVAWAAMGAKADELFRDHRPTFFLTEAREKGQTESINDFVNYLVAEAKGFAHRWVPVCPSFGDIISSDGTIKRTNTAGILAGTIASATVSESIGQVSKFMFSNIKLPAEWNNAHSKTLDDAGYTVLRRYAGLKSVYWSNGRTMADKNSDYQFLEVVRTTHKAIRLARLAALDNLQSAGNRMGLLKLKTDIATALNVMRDAKELGRFDIIIPPGQDIINNGIAFELELFGIPIIRQIKLFFKYKYDNPFKEEV